VNDRAQKGPLGKQLGMSYILDDRMSAVDVAREAGFECILFWEQEEDLEEGNGNVMIAKEWKDFREILKKIN
jgi:hypothetical protein